MKELQPGTLLTSKLVLVLGFGGLLILMGLAGFDSIQALRQMESTHLETTGIYLQQHHQLQKLRTALYLSASAMRDYLIEQDADQATRRLTDLGELKTEVETSASEYERSVRPEQRALFEELKQQVASYWQLLDPVLDRKVRGSRGQVYEFLRSRLWPRRAMVLAAADKIDAANETALKTDNRFSAGLFRKFRRRMVMMLALSLSLGLVVASASITHLLRLQKEASRRYEEALRARGELARLSAKLINAQEEERRSISRELHDGVGQSLGALLIDIGNLSATTGCGETADSRELFGTIRRMAEEALSAVRNMSLLLRPSMLDDLGLLPALRWQARETARRTGIRVEVFDREVPDDLPEEHKTCIYRVVQEALRNCARHAKASSAKVLVEHDAGNVRVRVQDDGQGFDPTHTRGLGLLGMEERAKNLGGSFQVISHPGSGTQILVDLPLGRGESEIVYG